MPYAAKRPCNQPGCAALVDRGYCDKHRKQRETQRNRQRGPRLYDLARWKRFRKMALSRQPVCQTPECNRLATDVDHVKAVNAGGERFDFDNVQCLCHSCHSRKTVLEEGGFGR